MVAGLYLGCRSYWGVLDDGVGCVTFLMCSAASWLDMKSVMDAQRLVCAGMVLVILSLLDVVRQWVEILCWDRTPTVAPC